jgi:hypothetical protein
MKIKIKVSTPKGQAEATSHKLKPFLIGFNKVKSETYVSPEDDMIFIDVEGDVRRVLKVASNCYGYDNIIKTIFKKKIMGKGISDALSMEDAKELEKMLKKGTKVEIIKEAELDTVIDPATPEKKTFWQTIKDKFRRID